MADDRLKRIEDKVDKVEEAITEIKVTLSRNTASLEEHMRRSDAIEEYVQALDKHLNENVVKKDLEPIKKHVNQVTWAIKGIFWFIGIVGTILITLKELAII
jgi:chromosome segregation ATPase